MDLVRALGETSAAGLQAWANVLGVRSTNGIAREEGAGGGTVVRLTVAEVQELRRALLDASETLLDAPISRRDFAALLSTVLTPSVPGLGPSFALDPPPPPAPALPAEIISIIVKQVRALYEAEKDDLRSMSSEHRGWKGLRRLQRVSKRWRSVVNRMYLEELHLSDPALFSFIAKLLTGTRAELLTKLFIHLSDFEATSSDNVGFALPDIIRAASHLRYLSIRPRTILPSHSFPSRQRRLRDYEEWNSYTGGQALAGVVGEVKSLRTLYYSAPASSKDVESFIRDLPELRSLDVEGDISHRSTISPFALHDLKFEKSSAFLSRFWVPHLILSAAQLSLLFAHSPIDSLAFTYDIEAPTTVGPATAEDIDDKHNELSEAFELFGGRLRALALSTPYSDSANVSARGVGNLALGAMNNLIGGGRGNNVAHIQFFAGPLIGGPPPAGGAAVGVGAAPALAAPRATRAGGRGGNPPNPPPGTFALPPAAPAAPVPILAPPAGVAAAPHPFGFPFGIPLPAAVNTSPFFDDIVAACPNLRHLELYGSRYTSAVVSRLWSTPIEHLVLSQASDDWRDDVVGNLVDGLQLIDSHGQPQWFKSLTHLELHGEWDGTERKDVLKACYDRKTVRYSFSVKGRY